MADRLNMAREVAALKRMTVKELRGRYVEVLGEATRSGNKDFLWKRIAWRMQANAEGGLTERARRRAEELANDADLRLRRPPDRPAASPALTTKKAKVDVGEPAPQATGLADSYRSIHVGFNGNGLWSAVQESGIDLLVVVDAADASGAGCHSRLVRQCPGQWFRLRYPADAGLLEDAKLRDTHALNLHGLLALARRLGTLPQEVWIYALVGQRFDLGAPMSPSVQNAIPALQLTIQRDVTRWYGTQDPVPLRPAQATHPV